MAIISIGGWSWPRRGEGSSHSDNFIREPFFIGRGSRAGKTIDRATALQTSAILCGARVISQGIAQVPLKLYRETDQNGRRMREPARDHPLYRILADQPNDFQTSFSFRETFTMHAVVGGDGYAYISRKSNGDVRELLPISPDHIQPVWDDQRKELVYEFDGKRLKPRDVLHVHGPSWSGYSGLSAVSLARETIGLSSAIGDARSDLFRNGGRPSGILQQEEKLSPEAATRVREAWHEKFGPNGQGGIAVLDKGWTFTPMDMTSVDSQTLETMKFLIEEVARFLMIFPQMLMQGDRPTYASVEQFFIAHVVHTLDPWMDRIEQEIKKSLIGYEGDNADIYPRFSREGLLRGAARDRAEFYKAALGAGGSPAWMTQNEVRKLENMNPHDEGDELPKPTSNPEPIAPAEPPQGGDDNGA